MIKLLREYSFLSTKDDGDNFMTAKMVDIQDALQRYFDTSIPGDTVNWALGTITRNINDAVFIDRYGKKLVFNRSTNPVWLYKHPDIQAQWDRVFGEEPPEFTVGPVKLGNYLDYLGVIALYDTPYIDASQCRNRDLVAQYFHALDLISAEISMHFPERKCNKLTLLDASSRTGVCINHDTHNGLPPCCVDIQYYTLGETNYTQRGPIITDIWHDGILNLTVFDAERMSMLVLLMHEAFPGLTADSLRGEVLTWPSIKAAMLNVYPHDSVEYAIIDSVITPDSNANYNHDRHMHVRITHEVNLEMVV